MTEDKKPSIRHYDAHVRIRVESPAQLGRRFKGNLVAGGMFVRSDRPPAVGGSVLIEFSLPNGTAASRIVGQVEHSRPANSPGEKTAGMALRFVQLDEVCRALRDRVLRAGAAADRPPEIPPPKIEKLSTDNDGAIDLPEGSVVGIDLGTTNSCVAWVRDGSPRVLQDPQGYETVPSIVFLDAESNVLVGQRAVERMVLEPDRCIYGSKRFIGRPFASRETRTHGHFFRYALVPDANGLAAARIDPILVPLEVAAAHILHHVRVTAIAHLGEKPLGCIITVPAYFGERQRQAVREAGRLAGWHVMRVLSEPTAAAVAYGYGRGMDHCVLVYDFGGGTFDVSVLRISGDTMEVLANGGDPFLGGSDFDDRLTEYVMSSTERAHSISLRHDPVVVQRIRLASEEAKKELTEAETAVVDVPYVPDGSGGVFRLQLPVHRSVLESLTEDLVNRTFSIVESTLAASGLKSDAIHSVILVGGQSRSPLIRKRLLERFGDKLSKTVHPDHAVALGAALVAAAQRGSQTVHLTDILPATLRIAHPDGQTTVLLPQGQKLPAQVEFGVEIGEDAEFVAQLYRGEYSIATNNEPLGELRLPGSLSLQISKSSARADLRVSADGLMSVSMLHPLTGQAVEMQVVLPGSGQEADGAELLGEGDFELVVPAQS